VGEVRIGAGVVAFDGECRDPEVVGFLSELPEGSRWDVACRAFSVGVVGLKAMGVAGHLEVVEREFLALKQGFGAALQDVESRLLERIDLTFDPDRAQSVSARLGLTIAQAHAAAGKVVQDVESQLGTLIADSFNPDLATSCVFRIAKLVADTRAELDRAFDPSYEGSHLARLASLVDDYFGEGGTVADVVAAQMLPVKAELLQSLQALRDLVVSQAAATQARRLSPASGGDFEDEVESVLCRLAKAYGDSVHRVGAQAGESGTSKKGDFIVQLAQGPRFVVEAKDHSSPITLRGDRGILAALQASMINRNAQFAMAVVRDEKAFPKEVGAFNDYDQDKILCRLGEFGELLEAAYRWARTALLAGMAVNQGLDVATVESGIEEARRALRELARIEGKAKAITKGADEILSLVQFQLRRANAALDHAAEGLSPAQEKAS
jgi:hypothetical protein